MSSLTGVVNGISDVLNGADVALKASAPRPGVMTPDELDDYIEFFFNKYDRDGSGYLGEPEIKALGKRMGKTKDEILYQLVMMDDEYVPGGELFHYMRVAFY